MIVGSGEWVVAYVKVGRFILFFMTTLITITRQSPNTTNNNNNYLSHSKIFGCKKKGILVVSFHSAPFSLSLSHFPLELIVVTTPLSLKTKLIIIDKFLNYKYNQIFLLLFLQIFLVFLVFLFNHQSIESNQLTNQSINQEKEKSISNYLLLLYLLFFPFIFLQPLTKIYSRWILQSYNFY